MTVRVDQLRIAAIGLFAVVLASFGATSFVRRADAVRPLDGVEWAQASSGPVAVRVQPESPADAAGLRVGDRLVTVDGRAVVGAVEASQLDWGGGDGERLHLGISRGGAERTVELVPEWMNRAEPYGYLALVGLAFLLSAILTALRWLDVRAGRAYTLLATCLYVQLVLSHTGRADALDWTIYWIDVLAAALTPALMLHVGIALSRRALPRGRLFLGLAYGTSGALVLAALWLSPSTLGGVYRFADPVRVIELRDRLETLFLGLSLIATVALLVKSHGSSSSVMHRSQMRWLLWGLGVGLGPFVLFYALPFAVGAPELPAWAQFLIVLPMLLVPAAFTAALARYRLQDLDLLLLRGVAEVSSIFLTFAVYAAVVFLVREGVNELVPFSRSASRYVGILVALVSYPQLRAWVRVAMDRAFYRKRYSYRATLLDWARELNAETDLQSLLGHLRGRIRDTLGIPAADVLVRTGAWSFNALETSGAGGYLELDQASLEQLEKQAYLALEGSALPGVPWARYLFSMRVKGRLRAILAVAERQRPDESLTSEDRALLATLAAHAGSAIEAARLVSEVRQRADEIERLHTRQARILENSPVGLLLLDESERILAWNRALEEMYGLPRAEAVGRPLSDVFPLHVVRRIRQRPSGDEGSEERRLFRLGMVNIVGRRLVANIAISPAGEHGPEGGAGGCVVTFDDVTGRVELEQQLLQQERLASLGLLAAGVAHEINTPLTGISSYAQLLIEDPQHDVETRQTLEKIERQTQRASGITRSLLNLARPERMSFELLDLNETTREVLQLFEPQIRGREVELEAMLAEPAPEIRGHKGKLQQVLLNLLLNARDAVGDSGRIEVAVSRLDDGVAIDVSDDGAGIPEDDLPRIFDPFFTTKSRGQGTGLGLSVSYGIVQEHGGRIIAESKPGSSTRFRVMLPGTDSSRVAVRQGG